MDPHTTSSPSDPKERARWEGEMFRLLAANVTDHAIVVIDAGQRITAWSKGAEQLLGYGESEVLGRPFDVLFAAEDVAAGVPEREIRAAIDAGRAAADGWQVRKDGSRFWCSGVLTPLLDEAGRLRGFAKIMRDLTERKLAQDRLVASDARFTRLLDANILGVGVTHSDGRVLEANDEYLRIIGHTRAELAQGHVLWTRLTPPDYLPLDEAAIAQALRDGACAPYEKEYERHSDGVRVPVQIAFTSLMDPPGSFVVYVIDLTGVKRVQEELRRANRNKDEFLAMLGHELRNPLAPMLNAVHILRHAKRSQDEAFTQHALHMIERQVRHMTRLVDDLLEVARVTVGKLELKLHALELHSVVATAVETARAFVEARRHRLQVEMAPQPLWIDADPVRIEQIVTNLLNNAAKYTDPGGVIRLEVLREGGQAVIAVHDTGIGIDAETLPRVFEPFTQADRGIAHSQGGLGVGLTLVRRFAELHGGSVSAASAGPGRGSTFTVHLPLMAQAPPARDDPRAQEFNSSRVRVLIVDDNTDAADSLRMLLELSGHEVHVAHTGPTGLEQARFWHPAVVLLDIGLPGLDGYEVAQALRREPLTQGSFLAAMTGYGQPSDVDRAYQAGFDRHLVKPVDPGEVLKILELAGTQPAGTARQVTAG